MKCNYFVLNGTCRTATSDVPEQTVATFGSSLQRSIWWSTLSANFLLDRYRWGPLRQKSCPAVGVVFGNHSTLVPLCTALSGDPWFGSMHCHKNRQLCKLCVLCGCSKAPRLGTMLDEEWLPTFWFKLHGRMVRRRRLRRHSRRVRRIYFL